MAITKHFALLVIAVTSLHIMLSEGRPIKEVNKEETVSASEKMSQTATKKISSDLEHSMAAYKDDFRPTSPGFSPGVGHPMFGNSEVAKSANAAHADSNSGMQHFVTAANKDDFRPTGPGHSPGVGHAFETKLKPEAEPRN